MTIEQAMRTYRLPNPTTTEDLECRWDKILTFGEKILVAGYYYNGKDKPSYFGAVYEHLEKEKNEEITERMVNEISSQIELCLTKMAEVVEIPLG